MVLENIARQLSLTAKTKASPDVEVTAGYASDLLSDVLAKAKSGAVWVTNHKHVNIVGVAVMLNLAAVIITGGIEPDEGTLEKAIEENVPLYTTDLTLYELVGKLYEMGVPSC